MATARLKNKSRTPEVINLDHDVVCADECGCTEITQLVVALNPQTGEKGRREITRSICASLHILPGMTVEVPDTVIDLPVVEALLREGRLVLV